MKRKRTVTKPFQAQHHAKKPPTKESFQVGEHLILSKYHEGHVVFWRERDTSGASPFIVSRDTFQSSTEEQAES